MNANTTTQPSQRNREEQLSPDGKWRSFPKVPNLLQYVSKGNYYGRIKVGGKLIRKSLDTDVWSEAKMRLHDFLRLQKLEGKRIDSPLFSAAVEMYKRELALDTSIKPQSKQYRLWCLGKIQKTWPEILDLRLDGITPQMCKEWAGKLNAEVASQYYNNIIGTFKQILVIGIKTHKKATGTIVDNPAEELKRTRIKQTELQLPEKSQFKELVQNMRLKSGGWGPRVGDLVEFLAYGGMRISSEAVWVDWEDVDWERKEIIVRGHPETGTKNSEIRRVPMISDMDELLQRLKQQAGGTPTGHIMKVGKCNEALARACNEIGISKLTHHDLRHLFATRCIEAGVDIPTVARWMGHKDGGALAMKTYGHLRNEHSQAMAAKVKF